MIYVEDTYGVGFHRILLEMLLEKSILSRSSARPGIRRMPAMKCNQGLYRKIVGGLLRHRDWRILVVIDSERRGVEEAAERDVLQHFRRYRDRVRVAVVEPMHEAWLCIGLGGSRARCRSSPVDELSRLLGRPYEKRYLADYAGRIVVNKLQSERDFKRYVELLEWLLGG